MTFEQLKAFLQTIVDFRPLLTDFIYNGQEDFLLKHGKEFVYKPLPKGLKHGPLKQCFANAYKLAKRKKWWYVEGLTHTIIPLHHAWVVNPAQPNIVVDPTWNNIIAAKAVYIGVPFNLALVGETLKRQDATILDDYKGGWPLFTGKIQEAEWRVCGF